MRNNRMKRWIGTLLALCLVVGSLLPTAAFAAGTDTGKAIQLVDSGTAANISGGQTSSVYFGTYQQSSAGNTQPTGIENVDWIKNDNPDHKNQGPYYRIDPIKWRVLGNSDGKLFLLSDQNLDVFKYHEEQMSVTWETSTMRSWLNGYSASANTGGNNGIDYTSDNFLDDAFSANERTAIAETKVVNDDNGKVDGGNDTTDKIFLLSIAETQNDSYFTDNDSRIATNTAYVANGGKIGTSGIFNAGERDFWRLRSPGVDGYTAAIMNRSGTVHNGSTATDASFTVRPAFHLNLNSVLFTSAATGGKGGTGMDSGLTAVGTAGTEWKLTLLDSGRESFDVETTTVSTPAAGGDVEVEYSGAKTGTNEYLSAMIVDNSGAVLYYGRLKKLGTGEESGTHSITIPALADGRYTLKVFNEEYNGDRKTDYASDVKDVALTVGSGIFNYTISFNANGGNGTMHEQTVVEGNPVSLSTNAFTRTGYAFVGWNTEANGSGTAYTDGQSITPTGSMTLYAQWDLIEYSITYHLNGGANAAANPATYTIETGTISLANPTQSGSIFGGWFDNDSFNGAAVTEIAQGSTGNKELWAKWGTECIVTFDVNGGEWKDTAPATFSVVQGDMITKPADPVRAADANASYRFDGWYTDNNTFANAYDFTKPVSGNLTLYARWVERHTASITIIGQSGQTYTNVSAKLMPLGSTSPVDEQHHLTGDNGNPVKYAYSVTADAGQYNLVITATENSTSKELTITTLENLKSANVIQDICLPESNKSSIVDDKSGLGVIAGGVNNVAAGQTPNRSDGHLEVKLPIASVYDAETGAADKQKIDEKAQTDGKTVLQELDIDLLLYQYDKDDNLIGGATNLGSNNGTLLEILIPIDTAGKTADGFAVYRVHDDVLHTLPYNGESFSVDLDEGFIKLNVKLFSSYAIAYGTSSGGGTNPDPGTGGGYSDYDPAPSGTPPVIVDPANDWGVIAYAGKTASMGITAFGANSYQWYVDRGDGNGFVPIPGATGPSYTTSPVTMDNDGYVYRCVAINAYGQATSPSITLNVFDYLSIPETGDNSQTGLYIGLVMIGLAGMGFSALLLRRRKS